MKRGKLTDAETMAWIHREIVYQAVRDLLVDGEAEPPDWYEARQWLFSEERACGSFHWCCDIGGLDPVDVREALWMRGVE